MRLAVLFGLISFLALSLVLACGESMNNLHTMRRNIRTTVKPQVRTKRFISLDDSNIETYSYGSPYSYGRPYNYGRNIIGGPRRPYSAYLRF
ncbi:hypothetical protein KR084_012695 [Drosophila pseudotakahashii]|nr:hypothetical protein KR084_012695 [Drosophila pseudotakahashii]